MIYLFNQTEELIDVIDEASLADFTHTIELNKFDRASFEIPIDYKPNIIKEVQFFGFQSKGGAFCLFRVSEKSYDISLTIQGIDRAESDLNSFIIENKRPGGTADQVLSGILEGTGYQLGNVDGLTRTGKLSFYYISVRQALVKIIESYACEFKIRYTFVENKIIGRYIDLNQRFGRVTGHQFEYGSNILNVTYEESSDDVVTALIGRGKGEQSTDENGEATGGYGRRVQFKDVVWTVSNGDPVDKPAGQNYVTNDAAKNIYGLHQNGVIKHRFGVYTNEDIEDPAELLKATYKELQRLSVPIVTFKANLLDLANAIENDVWIGDSVGIVRDQISISFEARIHKLTIDKLDDNRSVAELGDYQTLQAKDRATRQQSIIDAVSSFSESLIEKSIANEVERRNKEFDEKVRINKLEIDNAIKEYKNKAEETKRALSDEINQRFQEFSPTGLDEIKAKSEEALKKAGASADLVEELKKNVAENTNDFQRVKETNQLYERILGSTDSNVASNVARMALTSELFKVEVGKRFSKLTNLFYAPTKIPKYISSVATDTHLSRVGWGDHDGIRINYTDSMSGWLGVRFPLTKKFVKQGESLGYRIEIAVDKVPQDGRVLIQLLDNTTNLNMYYDFPIPITKTGDQVFTGYIDIPNTGELNEYSLRFTLTSPGNIVIHKPMVVDKHIIPDEFVDSTDYNNEYNRVSMSLLKDSFAIQTLTSPGAVTSQINLAPNDALIEASKIRLKGRTLADEITAIDGYFKRLFVGDARIGTLNSDIIRADSITADKLVMDSAMARRFVASDLFTDTLAAKTAFINKLRSVVVSATLLEGYKGRIGGFQIGTHEKDPNTYWLTGQNQFAVGMSNGSSAWGQTALWVNWGDNWDKPGGYAWYVKRTGEMFCYNKAQFWNVPRIHGNLEVTGKIIYYIDRANNKIGHWIHSPSYTSIAESNGYAYLYRQSGGYSWVALNKDISDRRYKTNIKDSQVSGLDVIEQLKTYSYRKEYDDKIEDISCGIMAQDVQQVAPEAFFENPDGAYSYNTFALVPYLIKAIQELKQKVERLETT
jgi:phage minor structural protein, N-terminal domain protein|uniref:Tail protein n=1 Tax=Siphoviridae sp. ctZAU11 TaxID=2826381 RepID=A0A8S5NPX9_9CAUD|nr:MAG TPA: tail protein [Siphoviridae sp. ctZAU11]